MRARTFLRAFAVLALLPLGVAAENDFNYSYFDVAYLNNGMDGTVTAIDGADRIDINIGNGSGMAIRASYALQPNVHVFAGYSGSNMDLNATFTTSYPTVGEMSQAFFSSPGAANWDGLCDLTGDGMVNDADLQAMRLADSDTRVADRAAVDGDMTDWRMGIGYNGSLTSKVNGFAQLFWDYRNLGFGNALFMGEMQDLDVSDNGFGATVGLRGKVTHRFEMAGHVTYSPLADIDFLADSSADMLNNDTLFGIGGEYWFTDTFSINAEAEGNSDIRAWLIAARYRFGS